MPSARFKPAIPFTEHALLAAILNTRKIRNILHNTFNIVYCLRGKKRRWRENYGEVAFLYINTCPNYFELCFEHSFTNKVQNVNFP